ncbi:hypothetical protein [Novispirillum itersonii]|uniref:Lipoprotein n=1 Tax=Novispirillum itersonii TaxID=189 RepID=A0A7W9ZDZ9_NOVIT|nr:hypothetical protein [Novispirillum itersonii]MBB6209650.1 hypothetical protein [Novispirillum itersonii]
MTAAEMYRQIGRRIAGRGTRRLPIIVATLSLAGILAGCADPWVDRRREAGKPNTFVGTSTDNRAMICHAGAVTPEVQRLAAQECARTKRSPVFLGTMAYQCSLTAPNLSAFDCR